jgi:hypothetical protein
VPDFLQTPVGTRMPDGISLHVGVNSVDPSHYAGFDPIPQGRTQGTLRGCELDAIDLQAIAAVEGFTASPLLGEAATVDALTAQLADSATILREGDIFALSFSGYGGEVRNTNSDQRWREATWALYDRQMPEDELIGLVASFRPGVRVLVIDDSSSSGTVRRGLLGFDDEVADNERRTKALPPDVASETYRINRDLYDEIQRARTSSDQVELQSAALIMTGFSNGQIAEEGPRNGLFTEALLRVWDGGAFRGNHNRFIKEIAALMPGSQVPRLTPRGTGRSFVRQRPLTI